MPSPAGAAEHGEAGGPGIEDFAPNPVRGAAHISWRLAAAGPACLDLVDVTGRSVRRLSAETLPAGNHATAWDGADAAGRALPGGVCFMRLAANGTVTSRAVLIVR